MILQINMVLDGFWSSSSLSLETYSRILLPYNQLSMSINVTYDKWMVYTRQTNCHFGFLSCEYKIAGTNIKRRREVDKAKHIFLFF